MSAQALLTVRELALTFGGVHAIADLSLEVRPGEVLAIIGPNGAGKTSLLNVVTRVFDATRGQVHFKGQDLLSVPRHQVAGLGLARTFQNIELFEAATALAAAPGGSSCCARRRSPALRRPRASRWSASLTF